ncbi:unnamed protein product [Clavelina lepadiformis]|uniref:BRCT domain-containing protein n=1 Tax=Clavelina lepadiformis TaxID=159417 RepID=A0ABP0FEN5_CLALP
MSSTDLNSFINGHDSVVASASLAKTPLKLNKNHEDHIEMITPSSRLPKPFDNLTHLTRYTSFSSSSPKTPSTASPFNNAWVGTPNSFIQNIPESNILSGCVGFVDVWSRDGCDNRSLLFARILLRMGATIVKKFTKNEPITHLIFKDGHKSYLQKAKSRQIKIVSCLWVERCRVTQTWVNESSYTFNDSSYKPPKKFREMQPLDPEEEHIKSVKRVRRKQAREEKQTARRAVRFLSSPKDGSGLENGPLASDTPYFPTSKSYRFFHPYIVAETPNESIQRKLKRMKEGKPIFSPPSSPLSSDASQSSILVTSNNGQDDVEDIETLESQIKPLPFSADSSAELHISDQDDIGSEKPLMAMTSTQTSQKSDMELTCIDLKGETNSDERTLPNVSRIVNSRNSEDSTLNFHLSVSSRMSTRSCDSSASLHHQRNQSDKINSLEHAIENTLKEGANFHEDLLKYPTESKQSHRKTRRILHNDDVINPASLLISPHQLKQGPRRSQRRSSVNASLAISSYLAKASKRQPTLLQSVDESGSNSRDSFVLPPVRHFPLKTRGGRQRYFSSPTAASVTDDNDDQLSDARADTCIHRTRRQSLSTAYEDNNSDREAADNLKHKDESCVGVLQEVPRNVRSVYMRKRHRESSSSSSSNGSIRRPTRKSSRKYMRINLDGTDSVCAKQGFLTHPRQSSDEFRNCLRTPNQGISVDKLTQRRRKAKKCAVMVLTSFHTEERLAMEKIVRKLGRFRIHTSVKDESVTHVVCGAARRTMNVLCAISRGLWLLSKEWITASSDAGYWLDEHSYEVSYFPTARHTRLQRCSLPSWKFSVFSSLDGHVYIAPDTKPPNDQLKELVGLGGGRVIESPKRAKVRVGRLKATASLPSVLETWVLDSITENNLKPTKDYLII